MRFWHILIIPTLQNKERRMNFQLFMQNSKIQLEEITHERELQI